MPENKMTTHTSHKTKSTKISIKVEMNGASNRIEKYKWQ